MKKKDIRTYSDYIDLKNNPTKPFLMISELIDNSISSFDNYYGSKDWDERLEIKVVFYFDRSKKKIVNGNQVESNSYIQVIDNAFGMSEDVLIDAVRLNKKNENSISKMNRHGRGLKQCAFYFGADLDIETWDDKGNISSLIMQTSLHQPNDEVELETTRLKEKDVETIYKRGTAVTISNVYINKSFTEHKFDNLVKAISTRYIKLIKSGKMEIKYSNDIEVMNSGFKTVEDASEPISKVNENFKYDLKKTKAIIEESKKDIEDYKIGSAQKKDGLDTFSKFPDDVDKAFENISKLLLDSVKDHDTLYKWDQVLDINKKKLKVSFWRLEKNKSPYRGYRVYEGERALLHPPISDDEGGISTYYKAVFPASHKTGSTDNRFAGEFDILDINASTSTDKSQFIFESSEDEEILNGKLRAIWEVFNIVEMKGRSDTLNQEGKSITTKYVKSIKTVLKSKFGSNISEIEVKDIDDGNYAEFNLQIDKKNIWKVKLQIDNQTHPQKIWDRIIEFNDDKPKMTLMIYSAHLIWQRINTSHDFLTEALIPISTFIAHYEIMNIIDGTNGKDLKKIDLGKIKSQIDRMNKSGEIINE